MKGKNSRKPLPIFFHNSQLHHQPKYEWAFGDKLAHPETTNRASRILKAVKAEPLFEIRTPAKLPLKCLTQLHDPDLVQILKAAANLPERTTFYPSVFPRRDQVEGDPGILSKAGYYCFDSGTPLTSHAWEAAYWSAASAYSAARLVAEKKVAAAYSLSRPPGHHAQRDLFGGYCYFNNAGIAAQVLSKLGKVAIVDIDFHHGNGTQSLFYRDKNVFFASIHGDPREYYPFFSGYKEERGLGEGRGFNLNVPLPAECDGQEYLKVLRNKILKPVTKFRPAFLVISAGFDTFIHDPVGNFSLVTSDYAEMAHEFARMGLPTVIVQEGGYATRWLGTNVATFLRAFHARHQVPPSF